MDKYATAFKKRISRKKIKIAVIGLGYVGLSLSLEFAKKGIRVLGIEVDKDRLQHIYKKESYITDVPAVRLRRVVATGKFSASDDFRRIKEAEVIIICVPTPLKRKYFPDISYIKQAVRAIARNMKKGSLLILESTTYPGTTEEVILPLLEEYGLRHGRDFYLCFSPERIDPGNKDYPLHKIPKVIGGLNKEAGELATAVYQRIIQRIVPVSSARTAEAVKLLENTFRLINIGLIDELAMMTHKMNIDIWEVIAAAQTKPFGFMPFYPGPGVGGHCIPKDPLYLYWKARYHGFRSRFIKLASTVISRMPEYVVKRVLHLLKAKGKEIKKIRVLVIGVTYKKDIKDLRKSPALDMIDIFQKKNIRVSYHDPFIPYLKLNHNISLKSSRLDAQGFKKFDCVLIATDHSQINYRLILKHAKIIFDTRNVYRHIRDQRVVRL